MQCCSVTSLAAAVIYETMKRIIYTNNCKQQSGTSVSN